MDEEFDDNVESAINESEGAIDTGIADHDEQVRETDKESAEKGVTFDIQVDVDALDQGYDAPFTVTVKVNDKMSKGDLMKALVNGVNTIKEKAGSHDLKEYLSAYKRWCCKMFNMSDKAFSNPDSLREETSKVETSFAAALTAEPTVEQMQSVPIIGFDSTTIEESQDHADPDKAKTKGKDDDSDAKDKSVPDTKDNDKVKEVNFG